MRAMAIGMPAARPMIRPLLLDDDEGFEDAAGLLEAAPAVTFVTEADVVM